MNVPLPLAQWLNADRCDDTLVAWSGEYACHLGQLRADVAMLCGQLQTQQGTRWALCFEDSYLFLVALLATLHAGKTPVIPGHCRLSLLNEQRALFDGVLSEQRLNWEGTCLRVRHIPQSSESHMALPAIAPDAAVELFTSGSTGQPKRIVKSIAVLDKESALLAARFATSLRGCRVVATVVPLHLYGLTFRIFLPMALGLPFHADTIVYAEQLSALDAQHRYLFISSPAFLKRLDVHLTPPSVAMVLSAGGMLPWRDAQHSHHWLDIWPDEIYGSTETGILAWRQRTQDDIPWLAFPGVEIVSQEDACHVFSPLIAHAQGLPLDDEIRFTPDGHFHLVGRRGRVIKIEEKRVSLQDVERRLLALDGIRDAAALPITRGGRQSMGALLVLDDALRQQWKNRHDKTLERAWRQALRPWLEPVAIPRYWRVIDEIPVNSMNKRVDAQLQEFFNDAS
jgi:Acyl-coenzyme A synthetases/AMP-(fatty) acid ligases